MDIKPAYIRIKDKLLQNIVDGKYDEEKTLPSERLIGEEFKVSRMTARKAVDELEKEGFITRIERKGAFIEHKKIVRSSALAGLSQALIEQGFSDITSIVLCNEVKKPPHWIAKKLKIDKGENVLYLSRVRCSNNEPILLETTHLPMRIFSGIQDYDFSKESLFTIMDNVYDKKCIEATRNVSVVFSDEYIAEHLKIDVNYPVFFLNSISYGRDKEVLEYVESYSRIDKSSFYYKLKLEDQNDYKFST